MSGYNLDELLPEKGFNVARALVGTESTCATVLQATLHADPGAAAAHHRCVVQYADLAEAGEPRHGDHDVEAHRAGGASTTG